ncbi:hypothetical protein CFter6_1715 [Collimonas fungivorans]|uniref:Uncharacterized protein n=1 Tax=Collimonas fungivorans TaxID=158899 RepID=A0A127P9H4_9BURK|nr:hypothetical protein CFter6_1715 [Collimonas fungivorans]
MENQSIYAVVRRRCPLFVLDWKHVSGSIKKQKKARNHAGFRASLIFVY